MICPTFRPHQKAKFVRKTGLHHSRYPVRPRLFLGRIPFSYSRFLPRTQDAAPHSPKKRAGAHPQPFTFSPPSLRESYVTVSMAGRVDERSATPSQLLEFAPNRHEYSPASSPESAHRLRVTPAPNTKLSKAISAPNLLFSNYPTPSSPPHHRKQVLVQSVSTSSSSSSSSSASPNIRSPTMTRKRRVSSIARQFGVDDTLVKAVAEQLGLAAGAGGR
jgi:hypothetical protein